MRFFTVLKIVGILVVALVVTAVAILFSLDLGAYKGEIAAAVKKATGRELVIDGELRPTIGLTPAITVDRVRFANTSWGSRKDMARIERFRAEVELLPILKGEIRIRRVVLVGADILLETAPSGAGNWIMQPPGGAAAEPDRAAGPVPIPTVNLVSIEDSVLVFRDGAMGKSTTFKVGRLQISADSAASPLAIRLRGSYNDAPVTLDGTLGSLVRVMSGADPLAIDLKARAGGAAIAIRGAIAKPLQAAGIKIALSAEGGDMAALGPLAGSAVPSLGPYRFAATLSDAGPRWALSGIALTVGKSSLHGEATVDHTTSPPSLTARLTSPLLRLADFRDRGAAAKPAASGPAAGAAKSDERVFPDDALPLDGLKAVNAAVTVRATRVEAPRALLTDVAVDLALKGGRLAVKPARFAFADGTVATEITVDAAGKTPAITARFDALRLDLAALMKEAGHPGMATGRIDFGGDVAGSGASIRAIMAGLDGRLAVTMKDGRLNDDLLELLSADVLKMILPFGSKEKGIGINCLVGRYDVKRGKLKSLATLFDTTRATVRGEGGADLADETLDFGLVPQAKEISVMSLLVPIRITGRFASPSVGPDAERLAVGAVGVVTGAVLTGGVSIIGSVIGGIVGSAAGGPASNPDNNTCVAALSGRPSTAAPAKRPAKAAPAPSRSQGPVKDAEKALDALGSGIKGLFGR